MGSETTTQRMRCEGFPAVSLWKYPKIGRAYWEQRAVVLKRLILMRSPADLLYDLSYDKVRLRLALQLLLCWRVVSHFQH